MGVSTDAYLAFGVDLGEEGIDQLREKYPEAFPDDEDDTAFEMSGLELIQHCHCNAPMWILAVAGTRFRATRGNPLAFQVGEIFTPEGIDRLKEVVSALGDPPEGEPSWLLFSDADY